MDRQKKQYRPIEGQKRWEQVLDWMTRQENFKWSLILLAIYTVLLFLSAYIPANILEQPDLAEIIFSIWFGLLPLASIIAMINPWSAGWGLRMEQKLQQPIKNYIEQRGSCTYDELIVQFMPVKIHLGIDDALEQLLRSHELVLEDNCYRIPANEERRKWHEKWLAEYGVKISFEDLKKIFEMDLSETEGNIDIGFSLLDGDDYWLRKDKDETFGKNRFFFGSEAKSQQEFRTFQELAEASLFDGQSLHSIWDNAALTFLNDEDIDLWLGKHLR